MNTVFTTLRTANEARQKIWDPENKIDLKWRVNELAGEAGELCNVLKKLVRAAKGLKGSRVGDNDLADELADVVICTDLVAMTAGINPIPFGSGALCDTCKGLGAEDFGIRLDARVGYVCFLVDEHHWNEPMEGFEEILAEALAGVLDIAHAIAVKNSTSDLRALVSNKFNATSAKVGLPVYLDITTPVAG